MLNNTQLSEEWISLHLNAKTGEREATETAVVGPITGTSFYRCSDTRIIL
jgi:hypothetical protein